VQCISYSGILDCWKQGNELLGEGYTCQFLSVHDPDEYLAAAMSPEDRAGRMDDILGAYKALGELRDEGKCQAIGVGSKDWEAIAAIDKEVKLDWVMLANSLTIYRHPQELLDFVESLNRRNIPVFNSAVFHAGYMVGGSSFDYRELDLSNADDQKIADYRDRFFALCEKHSVKPAQACVEFALSPPGVVSIALSSSKPERVTSNVELANTKLPVAFWKEAKELGLMDKDYPFLG
jgi:D-threo-aldose 1-dehydrogenase